MRFTLNPITDQFDIVGLGSGVFDETITGNTGGAVGPDGSGNINLLGDNASGITVVGSPGVSTLQIFGLPSTTTQIGTTRYATNAEAAAQSSTTAALTPSNIPSMFSTNPLPASQGGTGLSSPAAHSLLVTNGSSALTLLGTAGNGQIPIGAIGSDPVLANITSTGGTINVTNGPGTINIDLAGGSVGVDSFSPDSGTDPVFPTAFGLVNDKGSGSITTVGSLNTITTQLTGLTNHALLVGAGTTTITKVGPTATAGQVLQSAGSSADPAFSTATYPSTTTINQILFSSSANVVGGISAVNNGTLISGATGIPSFLANGTTGQVLTATTGSPPSWSAASGTLTTLTGDTGGAISPSAGNITLAGSGSITTVGSGSTITTQLTGLTNHNVLIGAGSSTITKVAPSATSGVPLISQGSSADPTFGTVVVAGGGTGATTLTGVVLGNGTSAMTALTYTAPTTYTPVLSFGGASVGITYSNQVGHYQQVGNLVFVAADISLSSKGSSTGNASITLPVAPNSGYSQWLTCRAAGQTYDVGATYVIFLLGTNALIQDYGTGGAGGNMTNTNFTNTSSISFTGCYLT